MTDIRLRILDGLEGIGGTDMHVTAGDLELDRGLETAVLVSLFTDARAQDDQDLPGEPDDLRGWWGTEAAQQFGSRLWLVLERGRRTAEAVTLAVGYAREALQWLVDEGIAASLDVAAEFTDDGVLFLQVALARGTSRRWEHLWVGQSEKVLEAGTARVKLILR